MAFDASEVPQILLDHPTILTDPVLSSLEVKIPEGLAEFFSYNLDWAEPYRHRVRTAVMVSFAHPETRLRGDITHSEIKLRRELVHCGALSLYQAGFNMVYILDMLPDLLVDTIRHGGAELADLAGKPTSAWGVQFQEKVSLEEIARAQNPAENIIVDDLNELSSDEAVSRVAESGVGNLRESPDSSYAARVGRSTKP
jgi:hypothetical protein